MNAGESQPIFSVGFGMAAEIRDERARPEAWLQREQWRSAQRALVAQGVELRKRTMPGMTPDAPTSE